MAMSVPRGYRRYAWPPVTVAVAALLVYFGPHVLQAEGLGFVFLAAVFASTVRGGMGPGFVATVLALLVANWLFIIPARNVFAIDNMTGELAYLLMCLIVVITVGLRRRALQALRASENRFRTAQELSLDAFTVLSAVRDKAGALVDFEWVYLNPAAERILGRSDLLGKRLLETLPGNRENKNLFERYVAMTESGEPHDVELHYEADGISGWFRNMAVKLNDGVAVSFSDITPRKQAEVDLQNLNRTLEQRVRERTAALERSQEALRRSERLAAIGEMMTGVSHESRNALQRSFACVQMLERRLEGQPQLQRLVTEIRAAHDELLRIYEGVVAYARPISIQTELMDVVEVWRSAWTKLIAQRNQTAVLREDLDEASRTCEADPVLLEQVFRNVFDNALAASDEPAEVRVKLESGALEEVPSLRIHVRDSGPGVPPELLSRIFEPFITTKTKGTGLGLAGVKRIVEAHGGSVEVGTGEVHGFELVIQLPRRQS